MSERFSWDLAAACWIAAAEPQSAVALADSWLLDEGRTTRLDLHRERFLGGAAELAADPVQVGQAWDGLNAVLPASGRWFPRVDLLMDGELTLALRPAPAREETVVAWLMPDPDPRQLPRRKGPELELLGELRAQAREQGAGEAVLSDGQDHLIEGAYSSLLWWEGERLCAVPDDAPALPGITRRVLLEIAAEEGVEVRHALPTPSELAGNEVWLVGSLHGIRAVSEWVGDGLPTGAPVRAPAWQQRLDQLQG